MTIDALVIHLARATQRRKQVDFLKNVLPMKVHTVDGVDGQALSADLVEAQYLPGLLKPCYPFRLTASEIACFLSHWRAWQAILDFNLEAALIMEDDAAPTSSFEASLSLARQHISRLGFIRFPLPASRERGPELAAQAGVRLRRPRCVGLGMVAQLVSRNAAERLLQATERFDRPVDTLLQMWWVTGVRPHAVSCGAIREISGALGGSTQSKRRGLLASLGRELHRPLYRASIVWRSHLEHLRDTDRSAGMFQLPTQDPPAAA